MKKSSVLLIFIALVFGGVIIQKGILADFAFPNSEDDLKVQNCALQTLQSNVDTFDTNCSGIYPSVCGASGDFLSCDDGYYETAQTQRDYYGGIRIENYNSSIENCQDVEEVQLCYQFWGASTSQILCSVGTSNNSGTVWNDSSVTCLGSEPASVTCVNVTNDFAWSCSNFFGTSGIRSMARAQAIKIGGGPNDQISYMFDTLFFNVSYKKRFLSVVLNYPGEGENIDSTEVNFNFTPSSSDGFSNCSLWDNSSGIWQMQETNQSSIINGTSNYINKTYSQEGTFISNVQCCDGNFCEFAPTNTTFSISVNFIPSLNGLLVEDSLTNPSDEIDLVSAITKKVNCTGIVVDANGDNTIKNASSEFFSSDNSFYGDIDDNNYHYTNDSCQIDSSYGNSSEAMISCLYEIWYYADAGNWECFIEVYDDKNVSDINNDTTMINALLAIGVNSPANYGNLVLQEVSPELEINVTNYGNVQINLSLSGYAVSEGDGYAMNCSSDVSSNISIGHEKYNLEKSVLGNLTLSQFEGNYTNLTESPRVGKFNLASRENELVNDAINSTYWRIYVPGNIAGGCQGNIIFGAVQAGESL